MAEVVFRSPHATDVGRLLANMRAQDRAEIEAAGLGVVQAIADSLRTSSLSWAALSGGRLLCLFGVAPPGVPWLLGTADLRPRLLMRHAPAYIATMLRAYPQLVNFVHADNALSLNWLRRMKFQLAPAAPYGRQGAMFHRFEMTA